MDRALARQLAAGPTGLAVTCASASMEPTIEVGEGVVARSGRARVGDVVVFEHVRGTLGLHRVVARLPGGWLVHCGDRPGSRPGATRDARVIGVVEGMRRRPWAWQVARAATLVARRAVVRVARRRS